MSGQVHTCYFGTVPDLPQACFLSSVDRKAEEVLIVERPPKLRKIMRFVMFFPFESSRPAKVCAKAVHLFFCRLPFRRLP
jgi:hypothetical protein